MIKLLNRINRYHRVISFKLLVIIKNILAVKRKNIVLVIAWSKSKLHVPPFPPYSKSLRKPLYFRESFNDIYTHDNIIILLTLVI